jgi:phenylalanyl-tRNA synthetase beta chain
MLISYNWLKSYVDFTETPEELSALLTDSGLEVEGLEHYESIRGGLRGIVTGKVLTCVRHPNADKLSLTSVDVGNEDPLPIVCGAPNVAAGQKVLVALEGTTLYMGKEQLTIKKAKIRGEVSQGMICAEDELGLGDSHDGIMVLPDDTAVGLPASDLFKVTEDWVFEIGLTPNRIDAASHIGVARDIVAVVNHQKQNKQLSLNRPDLTGFAPDNTSLYIPVTIEDQEACPRYSSLTISGVIVTESPDWLQQKLKALGLKPINNVVDVTNFVLQELGQPLHAFDVSAIKGNKVVVKKSAKDTLFVTLDEEELKLSGDDLMICNAEEPMCMGGILGGIDSGVTEKTTDIFLESACFDPVTIRKSSKQHGIKTEASFRFERGSDFNMTIYALKRAALLIKEVAGGQISSDIDDVIAQKPEPVIVDLQLQPVHKLIGKEIPAQEIQSILEDLDFEILDVKEGSLRLSVPLYRVDVTRPADVVEEILRIYGYNNVDIPHKMHSSIVISPKPDKELLRNNISDMLSARGFNEIMNNSLTKEAYYQQDAFDGDTLVHILNPLSQDLNVLRQTLLFGGLESVAYNLNRKVQDMKLYEFGNVYMRNPKAGDDVLEHYPERMLLELFMTGRAQPETWRTPESIHSFFDLKDAVYAIFKRLGLSEKTLDTKQLIGNYPFAFELLIEVKGKTIARLGKLVAPVLKGFDIKQDVFYGSLEWEALIQLADRQKLTYKGVPKFPAVRRDLALLLDTGISFAEIEAIAFNTEKKILEEVNLFDVYQDEKLGKNKKSYAVSFVFQADKTLTDKEIDKIMGKLTKAYTQQLGASIR